MRAGREDRRYKRGFGLAQGPAVCRLASGAGQDIVT